MTEPAKPFLPQDKVEVINFKLCQQYDGANQNCLFSFFVIHSLDCIMTLVFIAPAYSKV